MMAGSGVFKISAFMAGVGLAAVLLVVSFALKMERVAQAQASPNIVFVYSDDQDVGTMRVMRNVEEDLAANGVTFENAFATTPHCCPTRATFLRGQYSHNTGVKTNVPPEGGYEKFVREGYKDAHLGVWLQSGGYATGHIGKLMNGYDQDEDGKLFGFDYFASNERYNSDEARNRARAFIRDRAPKAQPFYLSISAREPHIPYWFPQRHADLYEGAKRPRTPNFNEDDVSDKPAWIRKMPQLTPERVAEYDKIYRKRLRGVRAVDDLVGGVVEALKDEGEFGNTYLVYSSDNGYLLGAHRLPAKIEPYEESIRVPLIVSGPGVAQGVTRSELAATNDVAPTIMHLAGLDPKPFFDGRSLMPLLDRDPKTGEHWRTALGIEWLGPLDNARRYYGVRTASGEKYVYHTTNGEEEYYDLRDDPYELENEAYEPSRARRMSELKARAQELLECRADGCRTAER